MQLAIRRCVIVGMLKLKPVEKQREAVLDLLRSVVEPIRVEPGCLGCYLCLVLDDPGTILLVYEWQSDQDLTRHLRTRRYGRILAAIELSQAEPQVEFMTVARKEGLEVIEKARGRG